MALVVHVHRKGTYYGVGCSVYGVGLCSFFFSTVISERSVLSMSSFEFLNFLNFDSTNVRMFVLN